MSKLLRPRLVTLDKGTPWQRRYLIRCPWRLLAIHLASHKHHQWFATLSQADHSALVLSHFKITPIQ